MGPIGRPPGRAPRGLLCVAAALFVLVAAGGAADAERQPESVIRDIARRYSPAQLRAKISDARDQKSQLSMTLMNPNLPASQRAIYQRALSDVMDAILDYERALRLRGEMDEEAEEDATDEDEEDDGGDSAPPPRGRSRPRPAPAPRPAPRPPPEPEPEPEAEAEAPDEPTPEELAQAKREERARRDREIDESYDAARRELEDVERTLGSERDASHADAKQVLGAERRGSPPAELELPFDEDVATADAGADAYDAALREMLPDDGEWRSAYERIPPSEWGLGDGGGASTWAGPSDPEWLAGRARVDAASPGAPEPGWLETMDRVAAPDDHADVRPAGDEVAVALDREVRESMTTPTAPGTWSRSDAFGAALERGDAHGAHRGPGTPATDEEIEDAASDVFEWAMTQGATEDGRLRLKWPAVGRFYRYASELLDRYSRLWDLAWTRFEQP